LPLGYTYNRLMIHMEDGSGTIDEADWGTNLGDIRLMVDGDAKIEIAAADLVDLNNFYGHTHDTGVLSLFLSRHWARTWQGEDLTGYGTAGGISSLTLEVDIKAGITVGTFGVYAVQSAPTPWGPHLRVQRFNENVAATGDVEIAFLPKGPYVAAALHLKSANISNVQAFTNDRKFHDTIAVIRDQHNKIAGRVPQAAFTHVDFLNENRVVEAVPMDVLDFRVKCTFTGTGAVPMYWESIQSPNAVAF
jgi:hypothetical protein